MWTNGELKVIQFPLPRPHEEERHFQWSRERNHVHEETPVLLVVDLDIVWLSEVFPLPRSFNEACGSLPELQRMHSGFFVDFYEGPHPWNIV